MTPAPNRRWFRYSLRTLFVVVTLSAGCIAEPPSAMPELVSASILRDVGFEFKGGKLEWGDPKWEEIRITDPKTLAKLESFFPNYRQRPTNSVAGLWMTGYEVYFNFSQGEPVRVAVAHELNSAPAWSIGIGDFETNGDFKAFVRTLSAKH
jgi:hypothetical protein